MQSDIVSRIIRAYDDPVVRAYCWARFRILRQRFLEEIGQYLPETGTVLDIGCGFGLFSLYYAATGPGRTVQGIDLNPRRIQMAKQAAAHLGLGNVTYVHRNALDLEPGDPYQAVYMLDIVHHVPPASVRPLLVRLSERLEVGGILLVKDVDTHPRYKRLFTWLLDRAMAPRSPVRYWSAGELSTLLQGVGFRVHRHLMVDLLPYPHVLYICAKVSRRPCT